MARYDVNNMHYKTIREIVSMQGGGLSIDQIYDNPLYQGLRGASRRSLGQYIKQMLKVGELTRDGAGTHRARYSIGTTPTADTSTTTSRRAFHRRTVTRGKFLQRPVAATPRTTTTTTGNGISQPMTTVDTPVVLVEIKGDRVQQVIPPIGTAIRFRYL